MTRKLHFAKQLERQLLDMQHVTKMKFKIFGLGFRITTLSGFPVMIYGLIDFIDPEVMNAISKTITE